MKSDLFIKALRKIIREEVQKVVKEELEALVEQSIVSEPIVENKKPVVKNSLVESIKAVKSSPTKTIQFANNNILNEILNDTANGNEWRSVIDATSQMAPNFAPSIGEYGMTTEAPVVKSVDQMLASAKPAGDVSRVQIDAVPDFSALMKTMKEKGQI
jgi:DNA-binding HxlR family transcriptional regulator